MKKSISRIIGLTMLIIAIVFIMFALNHPEKSFPWSNTITWLLYGVYFLVTVVLLIAPKMKQWESNGKTNEKTCCPKKFQISKSSAFYKVVPVVQAVKRKVCIWENSVSLMSISWTVLADRQRRKRENLQTCGIQIFQKRSFFSNFRLCILVSWVYPIYGR